MMAAFEWLLSLRRALVQLDQVTIVHCLPLSSETPKVLDLHAVDLYILHW